MKKTGNVHQVHVLDSSDLQPEDRTTVLNESTTATNKTKSIIGRPKVFDLKGNLLAEEENLVVLGGREIVAAIISGRDPALSKYRIEYFAIGTGGTELVSGEPNTVGPFDNDTTLAELVQIGKTTESDTSLNHYKYINDGKYKKIDSDGSVVVTAEEHIINGPDGQITVSARTVVTYNLIIKKDEPVVKPVKFNEAGLFAVEYDDDGKPSKSNQILFARFTTLDKYLDILDGIVIEWSILV